MHTRRSQFNGIMLIELMLSITISLFILGALTSIYLTAQKNYAIQEALAAIQENERTALQILRKNISSAKYGNPKIALLGTDSELTIYPTSTYKHTENASYTYFIGQTKRHDKWEHPIYALYMRDNKNHVTELVEGVDEMQIDYDIANIVAIVTHQAKEIIDWTNVVGLRIKLVFSAVNGFPLKKREFMYVALR